MCAPISELPSTISTMSYTEFRIDVSYLFPGWKSRGERDIQRDSVGEYLKLNHCTCTLNCSSKHDAHVWKKQIFLQTNVDIMPNVRSYFWVTI